MSPTDALGYAAALLVLGVALWFLLMLAIVLASWWRDRGERDGA